MGDGRRVLIGMRDGRMVLLRMGEWEKGFTWNGRWEKGFSPFSLVLHPFECSDKSQGGAPELQLPLVQCRGSTGVQWVKKSDFKFTKQRREMETIPAQEPGWCQGQLLCPSCAWVMGQSGTGTLPGSRTSSSWGELALGLCACSKLSFGRRQEPSQLSPGVQNLHQTFILQPLPGCGSPQVALSSLFPPLCLRSCTQGSDRALWGRAGFEFPRISLGSLQGHRCPHRGLAVQAVPAGAPGARGALAAVRGFPALWEGSGS